MRGASAMVRGLARIRYPRVSSPSRQCCIAPKCVAGVPADISLPAAAMPRNTSSIQWPDIGGARGPDYLLNDSKRLWQGCSRQGRLAYGVRLRMSLNHVTLDDKYDLTKSRVFVTGYQALVRLTMMQHERDK